VTCQITRAFRRLEQAQAAVLELALNIGNGATSSDIPGGDADRMIRSALRSMHEARHEADVALCSFMRNEPYQPRPTQSAQGVEMQARLLRNEKRPSRPVPDSRLPAVASVGSL